MANKKFSQFTNQPSSANTFLVGYDGTTNVRIPESDSIFKKGTEPLKRNVYLYPLQITRGFGPRTLASRFFNFTLLNNYNYAQPFWFQQKVNVTRFRITSVGTTTTGSFVIYNFVSEVTPGNPFTQLNFSLVHQEPLTNIVNGLVVVTLASPVTMQPGEVYIAMFVPSANLNSSGIQQQYNQNDPRFSNVWDTNKFLGGNTVMNMRMTGLQVNVQLTGGVAPATITGNANQGQVPFYEYFTNRFNKRIKMNYYKISKDNWSVVQEYATIEEAQAFADSIGEGYTVEYVGPVPQITIEERYGMDKQFCDDLINTFVLDNRNIGTTPEQNDALMSKFQLVLGFAQVGAVKDINAHLPSIPTGRCVYRGA